MEPVLYTIKKPAYEAYQYTGGMENGKLVAEWMRVNGTTAAWIPATIEVAEHISYAPYGRTYVGDYMVKTERNRFSRYTEEEFLKTFEFANRITAKQAPAELLEDAIISGDIPVDPVACEVCGCLLWDAQIHSEYHQSVGGLIRAEDVNVNHYEYHDRELGE